MLSLDRVVWRKPVRLFGFNVWNLGQHAVEFLATAPRGARSNVAVRSEGSFRKLLGAAQSKTLRVESGPVNGGGRAIVEGSATL